ncbi:MAG: lamin tail domain-containing protein [Flavobacteriales bacterium]|jgi:hypothetical protein|nr:lamin tail domain-containing protein [Flavobacteriales bacterium]
MKKILFSALALSLSAVNAQDCSELFFSEYIEGSSKNKALEIYNPKGENVDLSTYYIKRYKNGQGLADTELQLSGVVKSKDVVVVSNGEKEDGGFGTVDPKLFAYADIQGTGIYATSPMFFNGNDAMTLEKIDGTIVDIFGKIGEDPGEGWCDSAALDYKADDNNFFLSWTSNHTLVRKATVKKGITANPSFFNPALEYDSNAINYTGNLGKHTCECGNTDDSDWTELVLNVNEYQAFSFIAFANNGLLNIGAATEIKNVQLFNTAGQHVKTVSAESNQLEIPVESLKGIYILKLTSTENTVSSSKVNIQ